MKNLLSNIYIFFVNKHNEKIEREAIIDLLFNGTALKIFLGVKEENTQQGVWLNIRKKDGLKDIS